MNDMLLAESSVYLLHILTLEGKVLIVCLLLTPTSLFSPLEVMNSPSPPLPPHQPSCHRLEIPTAVIFCLQHMLSTYDKCRNRDHWKEIWHLARSHSLPTDDWEIIVRGWESAVPGVPAGALWFTRPAFTRSRTPAPGLLGLNGIFTVANPSVRFKLNTAR